MIREKGEQPAQGNSPVLVNNGSGDNKPSVAPLNFNATCPNCEAKFNIDKSRECPNCGYKLKCGDEIKKYVTPEGIAYLNAEYNRKPKEILVRDMTEEEFFKTFGMTRSEMRRDNWKRLEYLTRIPQSRRIPAIEKEISDRCSIQNSLANGSGDF